MIQSLFLIHPYWINLRAISSFHARTHKHARTHSHTERNTNANELTLNCPCLEQCRKTGGKDQTRIQVNTIGVFIQFSIKMTDFILFVAVLSITDCTIDRYVQ